MKIKTKLQLIIIVNLLLLAGIVSMNLLWQKQAAWLSERQSLITELNLALFRRVQLREEYFLYGSGRSEEQFLLICKEIDGRLESIWRTFTDPEDRISLNNMTGAHKKIVDLFNLMVRIDKADTVHTAVTQSLRERIIIQMLVNANDMYCEGLNLLKGVKAKTVHQSDLFCLYSNITFGLLTLFIGSFALIVIRRVTYPLTMLHKGTEIIAEGNLDYKTNIRTPDEIGQLSTAFDAMTENLKKITVSRDDLNKEVEMRKLAEKERLGFQQQLQQLQKVESLNRMAGAIAHHFNNLLGAVMGNLELAGMKLPPGSAATETLTEAMKASQRAAEVSRLMLTYLGQTPGKHELLDLSENCRLDLSMLRALIPNKVIVESEFLSPGPTIRANANQMQQVLSNLVTNAWESISDNRGTIRLTVKTVSPAEIPVLHRFPIGWQPLNTPYACLEVTDTGSGIQDRDVEKIFDPFFTTKFTGRGLGLPVVQGIVGAHGGGVTVESEPGRGSVFRVFFPLSAEEVHRQPDKSIQSPEIQGGGTVLLIEDEEQVRRMAKKMLAHLGYTVLEAKDGAEAVEIFQQHQDKIHIVLSDLTMPRMNGWETLTALRNLSPDIPVILSSGYDEAQVMAGEHTEQPNAFLGKPYLLKELKDTICHTLADKKK
ncbi:MAG: ATP-binding protein [Deltaproteobacteria bacterium]|nr:ATP-binding protein [Deltaproteobacteria bacterium]